MTHHDVSLSDAAIAAEIEMLIGALFDAQARKRIATAYVTGWITAEDALETMLALDLIEPPEVS